MTAKRYFKREWEVEYYIFDSQTISEKEFDEKFEYEDYLAFEDSMQGDEVVNRLNELHEENQRLKGKASSWKITASEEISEKQELMKQIVELKEENEQLKQQLKELKAYNNWLVSVLEDSGAIVEIKKSDLNEDL